MIGFVSDGEAGKYGIFTANDVQVRAADRGQSNSYDGVAYSRPRLFDFFDLKVIHSSENVGTHRFHYLLPSKRCFQELEFFFETQTMV